MSFEDETPGGDPTIQPPVKESKPAMIHILVEKDGITHALHSDTLDFIRFREDNSRSVGRSGSQEFSSFDRPQRSHVEIELSFTRNGEVDSFYTWQTYSTEELEKEAKEAEEVDVYTLAFAEDEWVVMRRQHGKDHFEVLAKFGGDANAAKQMMKAVAGE